jgi:hypothetical protein
MPKIAVYLWGYVLWFRGCEFMVWQRMAFPVTVMPRGFRGGGITLFVRGIRTGRGSGFLPCCCAGTGAGPGWLPPGSPRSARCAAMFEMQVIEGLRRDFDRFRSLGRVPRSPSRGADRGKLRSTSRLRHWHVRWCGVFDCRGVNRAACSPGAGRRVRSEIGHCSAFSSWHRLLATVCLGAMKRSTWSSLAWNIRFVTRRGCRYEFFADYRKVPSQLSAF